MSKKAKQLTALTSCLYLLNRESSAIIIQFKEKKKRKRKKQLCLKYYDFTDFYIIYIIFNYVVCLLINTFVSKIKNNFCYVISVGVRSMIKSISVNINNDGFCEQ